MSLKSPGGAGGNEAALLDSSVVVHLIMIALGDCFHPGKQSRPCHTSQQSIFVPTSFKDCWTSTSRSIVRKNALGNLPQITPRLEGRIFQLLPLADPSIKEECLVDMQRNACQTVVLHVGLIAYF